MCKKNLIGIGILAIVLIVLISGCVEVNIDHKIERSGNSDIVLTFYGSPMVLDTIKDDLLSEGIPSDVYYQEGTNSFSIIKNEIRTDEVFNTKGFDSKFKKEFKFPYYYYTYSITAKKVEKEEMDSKKSGKGVAYDLGYNVGYESAKNSIEVDYRVEVFGEITKTNGLKMSQNKVKFELDVFPEKDKTYYVEFKDFFLWSWIGSILSLIID